MKIQRILLFVVVVSLIANFDVYSQPRNEPKLVILISVDQMSPQYFERFVPLWRGGLRKLYSKGIVYLNCSLDYAYTETGPGHATMATGCFPMKHGIFLNDWYDPRTRDSIHCVRDSSAKPVNGLGGFSSPLNLKLTTIGDWLKAVSPLSRVVSLSIKDRSAILMGGHRPDVVCWYSKNSGKFVSSSYYGLELPEFVQRFDGVDFLHSIPSSWQTLSMDCDAMTSPDSMPGEKLWLGETTAFPHKLPDTSKNSLLQFTPFGDSLTLALALQGIKQMQLGRKENPDLLCIGLSCTDYIGHYYGPQSVEMCDQLKRLDIYMGKFFQAVDEQIGEGNYVVVLTSDHSMNPLPEYSSMYLHKDVRRIVDEYDVKPALEKADSMLRGKLRVEQMLIDPRGFLEYATASKAGLTPVELEKLVYKVLREIDFVNDIFFRRELVSSSPSSRRHLKEFRKSYYSANGPDFVIDYKDNYLLTDKYYPAQHSMFCMHVPLVIWWSGSKPSKISRTVLSVDIAPTLARLLHVPTPSWIDGKPLSEVIQSFK